jgi:hypothetical protein
MNDRDQWRIRLNGCEAQEAAADFLDMEMKIRDQWPFLRNMVTKGRDQWRFLLNM